MASKVLVKMPVAPFGQVNKSKSVNGDQQQQIISTSPPTSNTNRQQQQEIASSSISSPERPKGPDSARVAQLEQNIRFLQEQHQIMLNGLHKEIESLRNRNRELQFQLVFVKGTVPSSPSSPEDETKHKVYSSPKPVNITPLQIEILEKEMGELKFQLQEAESRNIYLSAIVDEQKKKLERYERDREKERERALQPDPELLRKLDDAETIIRRLRRENSDLRRETQQAAAGQYLRGGDGYKEQRGGRGRQQQHRGGSGGHYRGGNWFPPLHSQSFWQGGSRQSGGAAGGGGGDQLPNLGASGNSFHHPRGRGSNNNHYHDGRKYRGQKPGKPS